MSIIQISNFIPCFTKENLFLFTFVVLVGLFETWHFLTTINSLFDCISFSLFSFYYSLSCFVFLDFDTKISLVWTATISEKSIYWFVSWKAGACDNGFASVNYKEFVLFFRFYSLVSSILFVAVSTDFMHILVLVVSYMTNSS